MVPKHIKNAVSKMFVILQALQYLNKIAFFFENEPNLF